VGIYGGFLDRNFSFPDLTAERKKVLGEISRLRDGRDVLVYAADFSKSAAPIALDYGDLLSIKDQLSSQAGRAVDLILETPGGSGEVAEDVVRLLHEKYEEVGVIVPGWAKSAGTLIAMAGDEILMAPGSALGPIDAQLTWQGKTFSAEALIEGMNRIKDEVTKTGTLNKAYIPILQGISPGELQSADNVLGFAKDLVERWLSQYKFRAWTTHSSNGQPVTPEEKKARAREIAGKLCNHTHWKTHGRSISLRDLEEMRLRITDYSKNSDLHDAIGRYQALLAITFQTNIYKVVETMTHQIYRFIVPQVAPAEGPTPAGPQPPGAPGAAPRAGKAIVEVQCGNCKAKTRVQANLGAAAPPDPGSVPFPASNKLKCSQCGQEADVSDLRRQIEAQSRLPVVFG
jgi:hypothetical protein